MSDFFTSQKDSFIKKEREVARSLRSTRWWKDKIQEGVCYHCGGKFLPQDLTMDHLVPLARGGRSGKNNIVASCKSCNFGKSYKTLVEIKLKNL